MMRIVFMGTPQFAVPSLEHLINSEYQVVAVYTRPDKRSGRGQGLLLSPVKELALEHNLTVCQPSSLKLPAEIDKMRDLSPDVIVVVAFGQILPPEMLAIPTYGCLNVHPSLLPLHRGPSPTVSAILSGETVTGASVMLMDRGVDSGPVLSQKEEAILFGDTAASLESRLSVLCAQLLIEVLPRWVAGDITPSPQDEGKATYSHLISKGDGNIDWTLPAVRLWLKIRAFQPWPGCYTRWRGRRLKVLEAIPVGVKKGEPGRVMLLGDTEEDTVGVQTGKGILVLRRVQLEGKRSMSAAGFIRGQHDFVGILLPDNGDN
ncbi:MAG: methionyl-tRNA formyltransferase, partial [Dehalococcoidia bacterium]|nr:methionyl-tRNA formyltransferase [Dehalococcoidia bacterium]